MGLLSCACDRLLVYLLHLPLPDLQSERVRCPLHLVFFQNTDGLEVVDHGHYVRLYAGAARDRLDERRQVCTLQSVCRHALHVGRRMRLVTAGALVDRVAISAPVTTQRYAEWHVHRSSEFQKAHQALSVHLSGWHTHIDLARENLLLRYGAFYFLAIQDQGVVREA